MRRMAMLFGGCGGRVAEALVFAACAGALSVPDMRLMFVDPDPNDAHTARALSLLSDYERIRALDEGSPSMGEFRARFTVSRWPDHLPGDASTLRQWIAEETDDELLLRTLFPLSTASRDMRGGFQGDQTLAATVIAGLLAESDSDPEDALRQALREMEGEEAQIVLVGSVSGGTGGAGIPAMAAHLRERLGERAHLSAVLLLPYGAADQATDARAALRRYAAEGFDMPVCFLGLPESARVTELGDAARLNEWLAVHALDWLMRHDASDHAAYTYRAEKAGLTWNIFGREASLFRSGYIRLIKTAALFRIALTDELVERFSRPANLRDRFSGWYAACCRSAMKLSDSERQTLLEDLKALIRLLEGAWSWMEQLIATLPTQLSHADALNAAWDAARANEQAIADLSGQLSVLSREAEESGLAYESVVHRAGADDETDGEHAQRRLTAMQEKLRGLIAEQSPLNTKLGGLDTIGMLQDLLTQCRHEAEAIREQEKEARRRIDHAEAIASPQEQHLILSARTKLKPMQRHLAMQDARIAQVESDLLAAQSDENRWRRPVIGLGMTPSPGLFSRKAMARLREVPEGGARRRGHKQRQQQVQPAFPELAVMPGKDAVTVKHVLQGLAKVRTEDEHPLACLLSRAMALVLEEDAACRN